MKMLFGMSLGYPDESARPLNILFGNRVQWCLSECSLENVRAGTVG